MIERACPLSSMHVCAGGNYRITQPGRYRLSDGNLEAVTGAACLIVSDLDDTMVGDDAATATFTRWWQQEAVPRGSRLVYNTGRAMVRPKPVSSEVRCYSCAALATPWTRVYLPYNRGLAIFYCFAT